MVIGVPKEIKKEEYRVAMTPAGVRELTRHGHKVIVQRTAGLGAGLSDEDYSGAGAELVDSIEEVYERAEMIVKVKEPQPEEYNLLREGQVLFTYLHLAADENLTKALMERKIVGIAYETVETDDGFLPLLAPMSEIAGKMAVPPAKVVVIGAGSVGMSATMVAAGMGADVTLMDINVQKMRLAEEIIPANVKTLFSTEYTLREAVKNADLVIGAVLKPGARAPKLLTKDILADMKDGAVLVDVSIDQGGISEFSRPTTHDNPVFVAEGVVHYCVANMPGAVPRTSTFALTNSTLSYVIKLADLGWKEAVKRDNALARGVNLVFGKVTHKAVAEAFGLEYTPLEEVL